MRNGTPGLALVPPSPSQPFAYPAIDDGVGVVCGLRAANGEPPTGLFGHIRGLLEPKTFRIFERGRSVDDHLIRHRLGALKVKKKRRLGGLGVWRG